MRWYKLRSLVVKGSKSWVSKNHPRGDKTVAYVLLEGKKGMG